MKSNKPIVLTARKLKMLSKRYPAGFKICLKHRTVFAMYEGWCACCQSDIDYKAGRYVSSLD